MLIDNNNSRTFRPVTIMTVGKSKIDPSGSFRISRQYWGKNLNGLRSEFINSPPAANNSLSWSNCLGLTGHSEEFRMRHLRWEELVNVNYEQISFLKLLGSNWKLFRMYMTNQSYKRQKQSSGSLHGGEMAASQMRVKISNNNNS